tara:strand:- start:4770 stop:4988 length:219 start_codon:yes stop_codon:yes gene_type:complete
MKDKIKTHIKLLNILSCTIFLSIVMFSYNSLDSDQKFIVTFFGWFIALINAVTSLLIYKTLKLEEENKNGVS